MKRFLLLLSLLGLTFIGCRVELDSPAQVSEIGFNKSEVSLTQDDETTIFVKATDNRSLNNLVWSTSPSKQEIVEITKFPDNKASIKALKEGNVTIKVTEEYTGKTANIKINVNAKPIPTYSDIIIKADKKTINQEEEVTLKVTTSDNRKLNKINFTLNPSDNVSIVENNINGQITLKGVKEGNVVITAKEEVTNKTSKINITVKESPVLQITNLVSYSLLPGEEATFNLVSSDNKAVGDVEISYSTSDIVEVIKTSSNFTIKALKNGKTSITLTETKTGRKVTIPTFTVTDAYINVKDENGDSVSENASKYFDFKLDTSKNTITVTQKETREIKVPTVTLTLKANLSSSYIAYSNDIKINGTPATYSNIYIMAD